MNKVLFICTGNTCRSPMAQALLARMLQEDGMGKIQVESAGLWARENQGAATEAVRVMSEEGINLSSHRSRGVSREILEQADLILTMTRAQRDQISEQHPRLTPRVFTLAEYAGRPEEEIEDPYGQGRSAYQKTLRQMQSLLKTVAYRFKQEQTT